MNPVCGLHNCEDSTFCCPGMEKALVVTTAHYRKIPFYTKPISPMQCISVWIDSEVMIQICLILRHEQHQRSNLSGRIARINEKPSYLKVSSGSYTEWHNGIPYGMPVCRDLISDINRIKANPAPIGTGFPVS